MFPQHSWFKKSNNEFQSKNSNNKDISFSKVYQNLTAFDKFCKCAVSSIFQNLIQLRF